MNIRSQQYLAGAKEQACINCGRLDGTVVAAHYTGLRQHAYGKGTAEKCHDLFVADLCDRCHRRFDGNMVSGFEDKYLRQIDQSEQFCHLVLMTILRRVKQGLITIKGHKED